MNSPELKRSISGVTATAIVVANMVGTGIFTTTGLMAAHLPGAGWVFLCWFAGGLLALAGALCYSELATRMPDEGGEYLYLKTLFHPALGFLSGWTSFIVGFSVPVAASALSFAMYGLAGLGLRDMLTEAGIYDLIVRFIAVCLIILFTFIHYMGVHFGSKVQNALTGLKLVLVLVLAIAGLWALGGEKQPLSFQFTSPAGNMQVGTAMMLVMFAYSGWNASSYIAGEMKQPRRMLPVSLVVGTALVMLVYLLVNLFILRSLPFPDMAGIVVVAEQAAIRVWGTWMGVGLSLLISVALLSSLSAFIIIGPRVYYAMARDGLFFSFARRVHPVYRVPGTSIILQGVIASLMVIIGSFEQLLIYMGFSLSVFPWLAVAGLFIARARHIGEDHAYHVWGYPFVPLFYLLAYLGLMGVALNNRPLESGVAIITILAGIPCYYLWRRLISRGQSHER